MRLDTWLIQRSEFAHFPCVGGGPRCSKLLSGPRLQCCRCMPCRLCKVFAQVFTLCPDVPRGRFLLFFLGVKQEPNSGTMKKSYITIKQWFAMVPCPWSARQACCTIRVLDAVCNISVLDAVTCVSCPRSARHETAGDH